LLGLTEGDTLALGLSDGLTEGEIEGDPDGETEGDTLGETEGDTEALGESEGETEGDTEGEGEADNVATFSHPSITYQLASPTLRHSSWYFVEGVSPVELIKNLSLVFKLRFLVILVS
jgi:hypothetical protein